MRKADRVVAMVKQHAEELGRLFNVSVEKLAVVRNGFDEEDFESEPSQNGDFFAPGYLHLAHFGTIYPNSSGMFFPALAELVRESPDVRERLRVNIIGFPDENVLRHASNVELKEMIQIRGFIPHKDALQAMRSSHCLLLFLGDPDFSRLAVAGKTYEYLRVGRPILAVTHEGGVKDLVEEGEAGWVVAPDNTEAIKQILKAVLRSHQNDGPPRPPRPEFVAQFRWDHQAENLARVFHEAVGDDH